MKHKIIIVAAFLAVLITMTGMAAALNLKIEKGGVEKNSIIVMPGNTLKLDLNATNFAASDIAAGTVFSLTTAKACAPFTPCPPNDLTDITVNVAPTTIGPASPTPVVNLDGLIIDVVASPNSANGTNFVVTVHTNTSSVSGEDAHPSITVILIKPTIEWEKRDGSVSAPHPLQGGATFTITPNPFTGSGSLDVTDNDVNDADPDNGQFKLVNVSLTTYTIVEKTPPAGYIKDPDTRSITVSTSEPNPVIGTQGVDDDGVDVNERDFHNTKGMIEWEKRDATVAGHPLLGGATFTVTPNPFTGSGQLNVADNDANDKDTDNGQFKLVNVLLGTYNVVENIAPPGYIKDPDPRSVTASTSEPSPVIGTQGVDDDVANVNERDFHNTKLPGCNKEDGCKVVGGGRIGPKADPEKKITIWAYSKLIPDGVVEVEALKDKLTIRSTAITSVTTDKSATPKTGTITGIAHVSGGPWPGVPGDYAFTVDVIDANNPSNGLDVFQISIPAIGYLNKGNVSIGDITVAK